ncbi:hypothetical protein [Longispora albida]|uniref:hypothetical protein n=1 Tax=Longispora albida TaxID=203523 RepID=UPI00036E10AC|nr:hypothetical protein [Longispora albida]
MRNVWRIGLPAAVLCGALTVAFYSLQRAFPDKRTKARNAHANSRQVFEHTAGSPQWAKAESWFRDKSGRTLTVSEGDRIAFLHVSWRSREDKPACTPTMTWRNPPGWHLLAWGGGPSLTATTESQLPDGQVTLALPRTSGVDMVAAWRLSPGAAKAPSSLGTIDPGC